MRFFAAFLHCEVGTKLFFKNLQPSPGELTNVPRDEKFTLQKYSQLKKKRRNGFIVLTRHPPATPL